MSESTQTDDQHNRASDGTGVGETAEKSRPLVLWISSTGQKFSLTTPSLRIGRGDMCDVQIANDGQVSTRHGLIEDGMLTDTNSTNGTSVNGKRLNPGEVHQLRYGDVIIVGGTEISVVEDSPRLGAPPDNAASGQGITQRYSANAMMNMLNQGHGRQGAAGNGDDHRGAVKRGDIVTTEDEIPEPQSVILRSSSLPPPVDEILRGDSDRVKRNVEQLRNEVLQLRRKEAFARQRQMGGALGGNHSLAGSYNNQGMQEFQSKISELNNEIQGLKFNLHYGNLEGEDGKQNTEAAASSDGNDVSTTSSNQHEEELKQLQDENKILKQRIGTLESDVISVTQLNTRVQAAEKELEQVQAELITLKQDYQTLQQEHTSLQQQHEEALATNAELKESLATASQQQADNVNLLVQYEEAQQHRVILADQLAAQASELDELRAAAAEGSSSSESASQADLQSQQTITSLHEEIAALKKENEQVRGQFDTVSTQLAQLLEEQQQQESSSQQPLVVPPEAEEIQAEATNTESDSQQQQQQTDQIESLQKENEQLLQVGKQQQREQDVLVEQITALKQTIERLEQSSRAAASTQSSQINTNTKDKASSSTGQQTPQSTTVANHNGSGFEQQLKQIQSLDPATLLVLLVPTTIIVSILTAVLRG